MAKFIWSSFLAALNTGDLNEAKLPPSAIRIGDGAKSCFNIVYCKLTFGSRKVGKLRLNHVMIEARLQGLELTARDDRYHYFKQSKVRLISPVCEYNAIEQQLFDFILTFSSAYYVGRDKHGIVEAVE